jgi:hypothetical protein
MEAAVKSEGLVVVLFISDVIEDLSIPQQIRHSERVAEDGFPDHG